MKNLYTYLICICFAWVAMGQSVSVSGPPSANLGDIDTYTATTSGINMSQADIFWYASPGNSVDPSSTTADVTWNDAGAETITFEVTTWTNVYSDTQNVTVSVPAPGTPTLVTNGTCGSQATLQRVGTPPSGVTWYWQGQNASGTSTSLGSGEYYYPNSSTGGTGYYYIRARHNSSGTWSSSTQTPYVTVTLQPTFTFSSLPALCVDESAPISLQGYTDATTTFSGTGVSSGSFDPFSAGVGTHTITASRTVSSCTYTTTQNITVTAQPTFTFNTLPSVCVDAGTVSLQGYTNATTSFSGTGVSSNIFNPSTAGVGTHTITATRTVSGCSYATTQSITVKALPTFTFNALPSVCVDASSFDLQSYTTEITTFSAPEGVSGTTFNPAVAGAGTHTVTATRIVNGCAYVTTRNITVHPLPTFTFSALPAQCSNGASLSLQSYTNQTTTFSGTGVSSNTFNPSTAGVGTHTITATRTDNGCVYATTQSIVVNAAPNFTFSTINPVCADAAIIDLQSYTTQITTFSGTGVNVSTSEFDPNTAGAGTHTITATQTSGGCSFVTTRDVVVEPIPALASGVNVERFGTGAITLTATPGTDGNSIQWYSSTSGGASIGTGTSYTVPNLSSTTTYYAATYNTTTLCEDLDRAAITATVLVVPTVSSGGGVLKMRPEETLTLTATAGHTNYEWFRDNVQVQNGASNELVIDRPGDYTVTITSSGNATVTTDVVTISSHLDTDENSVITYTFREAISASNPNPFDYTKEQVSINASIYDGLGRLLQNVSLRSSPDGNDMVAPVEYDSLGRKIKEYLPYESTGTGQIYKSTALVDQPGFYQTIKSTDKAFAETRYESSPLNRPLEQGAPGDTWQIGQRTMKYVYDVADSAEVIQWNFETLLSGAKAVYDSGLVYENTAFDEDSSQMVTYTDRLGRTILKKSQVDDTTWAETYYIYDVYDQLAVVIPPEATARLDTAFFNKSATARAAFLNTWAFLYDYDGLKRMTMKKVPGTDSVFMVYDRWDRLVLTQDGNQRANTQWLFTKYDALNRPVMTGLATIAGTTAEVRHSVDTSTQRAEAFSALGINEYTDVTFPPHDSVDNYLTVAYYDYYQWDTTGLSYTGPAGLMQDTVRGQVTGALTRVGNVYDTLSGNWIKSVSYYDDRYRVIQIQSTNHLGGTDIVTNDYDFIGQVTKSVSAHNNGSTTQTITRTFAYDHVGRLLKTWHQLNDEDSILIADNSYNELGELIEKDLHGGVQSLDYAYNVRGWLTRINNSSLSVLDTLDANKDLFGMELFYDVQDGSLNNSRLYNGNISAMRWSDQAGTNGTLAYTYGYDKLNRLETADHFMGATDTASYDVQGLSYDLNGNIESLQRRAQSTTAFMDDLSYSYVGNQLRAVSDDPTADTTGFYDGFTATINTADYEYDSNGNMVKDRNKGIDSIYYNHLNLPVVVDFEVEGDSIRYLYDAAGIKLNQKVFKGGFLEKETDYSGEFIYEDGVLQLIQHEEGRIVQKGNDYIVYENDASSVSAFASYLNVTKTTETINGETYVKVVSNQATGYPGVWPIGGYIAVEEGREYTLRIKGYTETSHQTGIWVKGNSTIIWPGPSLPNGSANEGWIETSFTVPTGVTQIQVGVEWLENPSIGETFLINSLELRAESNRNTYDYQYHLKDHLGNVRMTFSTTPENYTMVEDFEGEDNGFENYNRIYTQTNANTTVGGDQVCVVNGNGEISGMVLLNVNKGDTINLSVNANYESDPSGNTFLALGYNALFNSFDGSFGGSEGVSAVAGEFNDALSGANMADKSNASSAPRAYLNYIIFDEEMNYVTAGYQQVSTAARGVGVHELLTINDRIPKQDGYFLAYLSNENQEQVYMHFDDFTVYHGKTNVVSTQDYYPFGLTFNETVRVASTEQRFLYNQGAGEKQFKTERVKELSLNWDMTKYRTYDYAIGRFMQVDPLADAAEQEVWTPYHYALNNPLRYNDPYGDCTDNSDPECGTQSGTTQSGEDLRSLPSSTVVSKIDQGLELLGDAFDYSGSLTASVGIGANLKIGPVDLELEADAVSLDFQTNSENFVEIEGKIINLSGSAALGDASISGQVTAVDANASIDKNGNLDADYNFGDGGGQISASRANFSLDNSTNLGVGLKFLAFKGSFNVNLSKLVKGTSTLIDAGAQYLGEQIDRLNNSISLD